MARGRGRGRGKRRKPPNQGKICTKSSTPIGQVFHLKRIRINQIIFEPILANVLTNYKTTKFYNSFSFCFQVYLSCEGLYNFVISFTPIPDPSLISMINVKSRLLILKKIHPPRTFPPSTFIDLLDFSTFNSSLIAVVY